VKTAKIVASVEEDGAALETHTIEIPLYDTIRADNIPVEVLSNLVRNMTDIIVRDYPEYAKAYAVLINRINEAN